MRGWTLGLVLLAALFAGCARDPTARRHAATAAGARPSAMKTELTATVRPSNTPSAEVVGTATTPRNTPPCTGTTPGTGPEFRLDGSRQWKVCYGVAGGTAVSKRLLASSDGGVTWAVLAQFGFGDLQTSVPGVGSLPGPAITALLFLSAQDGWMGVGQPNSTSLLRTRDGGSTWSAVIGVPRDADVIRIWFGDAAHGEIESRLGVWDTSDGGDTWQLVATPTPRPQ